MKISNDINEEFGLIKESVVENVQLPLTKKSLVKALIEDEKDKEDDPFLK